MAVQYYSEHRVELAQALINAVEDVIYPIVESPNPNLCTSSSVRTAMFCETQLWQLRLVSLD
jgi:hypothetical protein